MDDGLLLDTGLLPPAANFAWNRALLDGRAAGEIPDALRFLRFTPSALVGCHQRVADVLDLEACAARGITVQRRLTGGGAIYFDERQLGWELYLHRASLPATDLAGVAALLCGAAAEGLRALGISAAYRPRNDIEVGGKKLSGTGGVFEGDVLMYQGTLLLEVDLATMFGVLRVPTAKWREKALAEAAERVTDVRALLGRVPPLDEVKEVLADAFRRHLGRRFVPGTPPAATVARQRAALDEIDRPAWVYGEGESLSPSGCGEAEQRFSGGTVRAAVRRDGPVLRQLWLSGDFFVSPRRAVADLEAALKGTALAEVEANVADFFAAYPTDWLGLTAAELAAVIRAAGEEV